MTDSISDPTASTSTTSASAGSTTPAAAPYSPYPYAIVRIQSFGTKFCAKTQAPLTTPWVIARGGRPFSREAILADLPRAGATMELIETLDLLNEGLPDCCADLHTIALVDTSHPRMRTQNTCSFSFSKFEEQVAPLGRGTFDLAMATYGGESISRLGAYAAQMLAPGLATFMATLHSTPLPAKLLTPAEKKAKAVQDERDAAVLAQGKQEREALGAAALALFGEDTDELAEKARRAIVAIDVYRAVTAGR